MRYPVSSTKEWAAFDRLGPLQKLSVGFREMRRRRKVREVAPDDSLQLLSGSGAPLGEGEIALIVCVRNGAAYLPLFLQHYRALGVARFVVVDDNSSDGTRALLAECPDADLYGSQIDFTQSLRGARWRDALFERYGRRRWYVVVDVDEFLIFPGCENRKLHAFVADLARTGRTRSLAPMLDTYPDGPLESARLEDAARLEDVGPLIDRTSYVADVMKYCLGVRGGPRHRLYGNFMRLTKFPVIFVDDRTCFTGASVHGPFPHIRNYQAPTAVLLHLKFTASSAQEFREFVRHGHHFGGAQFYRDILDHTDFTEGSDLRYEGSMRWQSAQALVDAGFMLDTRGGDGRSS
jgi:hypothetical protein